MWLASRNYVKSLDSTLVVLGPSFSATTLPGDEQWDVDDHETYCETDQDKCPGITVERPTLLGFLDYCDSVEVFPDWLDWHCFNAWGGPNTNNIYTEAKAIRDTLSNRYGVVDMPLSVTEMMSWNQYMDPGVQTWFFANAERARAEWDLQFACRSYWNNESVDPEENNFLIPDEGPNPGQRLNGLIDPNPGSSSYLKPRYAWWATRAYAEMTGDYVPVTPSTNYDAVAAKCSADTARVLVGRFTGGDGDTTVTVVLKGLHAIPGLVQRETVQVRVRKYLGGHSDRWIAPVSESMLAVPSLSVRYPVEGVAPNDSVIVVLGGAAVFDTLHAVALEITPPDLQTITAAQDQKGIQNALEIADLGDQVEVSERLGNEPYNPIVMKRRVSVLAASGTPIIASSADSIPVVFGAAADSFTALSGFRIEGRSTVSKLVELRGQGRVIDCEILGLATSPPRLVSVESGQGQIRGCTISVGTVSYSATGIYVTEGAGVSVDSCNVLIDSGDTTSVAVFMEEDLTSSATITGSYLISSGRAMTLWGTTNVTSCTVLGVTDGIVNEGGSATVENTVVAGVQAGGAGIESATIRYCVSNRGLWSSPEHSFEYTDPLFCGEDSTDWAFEDRFSLRVDSPCSPHNNNSGELIGIFPVRCMYGELQRSGSVDPGETIQVWGDTRVPIDKALRIEAGATLEVDRVDNQEAGVDSAKIELRVYGDLYVAGTENSPVTIRGATGSRGEWSGLVLSGGYYPPLGKRIKHAIIEDATYAIRDSIDDPVSHLYLEDVTLRNFETAGLYLSLGSSVFGASACSVMTCTIDMRGSEPGAPYGIYCDAEDAYTLLIESSTIVGDAGGVYGLYLNVQGNDPITYAPEEAVVRNLTVDSLSTGTGVYVAGFSPELAGVDVTKCKWGIQLRGTSSPRLEKVFGNSNENDLIQCTTGLYVGDSVDANVDDVNITVPQYQTGLYVDGSSTGSYDGMSITGGGTGFQAWSTGSYTLRSSRIENFSTYGVRAASASLVDLGTIGDPGNNIIRVTSGSPLKYVTVKNRVVGLGDIKAEKNYWGTSGNTPPSASLFSTGVDYDPWLTESQMPSLAFSMALAVFPTEPTLAFAPNPFVGGGVIQYSVPEESGSVDVSIFDLRGRLVRTLAHGEVGTGEFELTWDGRDARGGTIASGIYFLRLSAETYDRVVKIVKLR